MEKLKKIWEMKDLRNAILFVFFVLIIFRIAAHIPLPGVNLENLKAFFKTNQIFGLFNLMTGGTMERFSIIALGIGPYITSSIIFQLLTMVIPKLEELSKEGESGYQKINHYTRLLSIPLAALQSYGMIVLLQQSQREIISFTSSWQFISTIIIMTTGTMFLMWLGELISEKHVGNGISLLIFAGIVTELPASLQRMFVTFTPAQLSNLAIFLVLGIITIAGIVFINEAQRNIPVTYGKRVRGMRVYSLADTYLPLRVNQAGMIPIIFAISIVLFPPMIAQFFLRAKSSFLISISQFVINLFQNQIFYGVIYFILVVAFTYFYTSIIFHPQQIAENLQKQGGFIPGIRPGQVTTQYLSQISNRIMLAGALFLGLIAILPLATQPFLGVTGLVIGGAGLLIVVSVVIETFRQIEAQITMREYEK